MSLHTRPQAGMTRQVFKEEAQVKYFIAALVAVALAAVTIPAFALSPSKLNPSDTGFRNNPLLMPILPPATPPAATPVITTPPTNIMPSPPLNVQLTAVATAKKLPISTDQVKGWLLAACISFGNRNGGECTFNSKTDDNAPTDFIVTATLAPSGKGGLTVNLDWTERGKKPMAPATQSFAKPTPKDVKAFVNATLPVMMTGMVSALEARTKPTGDEPGDFTTGLVGLGERNESTQQLPPTAAIHSPAPVDSRRRRNDKVQARPNWPWYVTGFSGALGIGVGWVAYSERGKIATAQDDFDHAVSQAAAEAAQARGEDAKSRATIFGASAIGVATVGMVVSGLQLLGVFDREVAAPAVTVAPTPSGAAVGGRW